MKRRLFYRNAQADDNLELFLVSAVSSLLLLRFFLYLSGYPQVGGGSLHIAHMLYGGLFMMAAIVIHLSFLGIRVQRLTAFVGGIGFGIFIDELGKFITKDNDYFFRPTIGLIYAIFVVLYLIFNFLARRQHLTSEEYQLNALRQFEEAVVHDMDKYEKATMAELLKHADPDNMITQELKGLLKHVETVPADLGPVDRARAWITKQYGHFWQQRQSNNLVGAVFIAEAVIFLLVTLATVFNNLDTIRELFQAHDSYSAKLIVGQLMASAASAVYAIAGAIKLPSSRPEAFDLFRRAMLINLFLTEFFIFTRIQFGAIPGFLVNLVLLLGLRAALYQERRS